MIVTQSLVYLIKSYCRTSSYSVGEVAKLAKMKESELRKWLDPNFLPEAESVKKFAKNVKIPSILIWEAYFNSVQLWDHESPDYRLVSYEEYKNMIKFNRRNRKQFDHRSSPWDEGFEIFGEMSLNSLSLGDLLMVEQGKHEGQLTASQMKKKYKMSEDRIKQVIKGAIPTVKELDRLTVEEDNYTKRSRLKGYVAQVIVKYKLDFYLMENHSVAYLNLLNRVVR